MDTRKLVVGQDIGMYSGCYWNSGKVVKVTPDGVWVDVHNNPPKLNPISPGAYHFDRNGKGLDHGTYECGPWHLAIGFYSLGHTEQEWKRKALEVARKMKLAVVVDEVMFESDEQIREYRRRVEQTVG